MRLTTSRELYVDSQNFPQHNFKITIDRPAAPDALRLQRLAGKAQIMLGADKEDVKEIVKAVLESDEEALLDIQQEIAQRVVACIRKVESRELDEEEREVPDNLEKIIEFFDLKVERKAKEKEVFSEEEKEEIREVYEALQDFTFKVFEATQVKRTQEDYKAVEFESGECWEDLSKDARVEVGLKFYGLLVAPVMDDIAQGAGAESLGKSVAPQRR